MTKEGRLARGKENHDRGRFPENQETIDYVASIKKTEAPKKEEAKDVKPDKRTA